MSVALPQAGERSDEGAEVVVRLGVVAAFDSKLEEGQIRIDDLELGCLLPNRIESVLKNCQSDYRISLVLFFDPFFN